jgi:hypothetical protein
MHSLYSLGRNGELMSWREEQWQVGVSSRRKVGYVDKREMYEEG